MAVASAGPYQVCISLQTDNHASTTPLKVFYRPDALPAAQPTASKRTDNGGEYVSAQFEQYLKEHGITHEVTTPYTPQQNGVSERLNRTLKEMALSQILHASLPKCFGADSIATACYVRNRLPVCPLNVTPYER